MKLLCKIIHKTTIILIVLGFVVNSFSNFPFKKIKAQMGNLEINEILLNKEYGDDKEVLIEEVEEMRSFNSKVFKTNSGKYEYHYYDTIIHSYNEEIGFEEIDSSFEEISNEYSSDSLKYNIKVPKKINNNKKIKLSYENTKIELSYNNVIKRTGKIVSNVDNNISSLNHLIGTVKYENIYDGVDLELITNSTSLKENVILNKYIENFKFSYNISLTNLSLVNENNFINFYNDENELIYQINPYFMFDLNNNISYDIELEIEEIKKDNYQITIIPDDVYLSNANYPVTIDPTIIYGYNLINNYIQIKNFIKGNITSNYKNNVSVTKYINSATSEDLSEVSIMKIDISQLPKNVMYSSAELRMYSYSDCCKTEEITVNDIYSGNNTNLSTEFNFDNVNGTSSYNKRFLSTQEQVSSTLYSFDILNAVKKDDDNIIYLEFSADRFTVNDVQALFIGYNNATYSPKIVLKYYETSGLKDYWTYHSSNLGNAGTMYINDFSGNLVIERVDYENPSERISFNLVQYYNSFESEVNIGYGNGWRFNYSDFIKEFTSVTGVTSSNYYTHIDGTGHKSYYKYLPTEDDTVDQFVCEDGDDSIIELGTAASGSNYCEMIVDGEYYYDYKSNGELHFIQKNDDSNFSTTINFEHSSLSNGQRVLYLIVDAVGNRAKFIYNENDLLEKIVIEKKKIENEISSLNIAYQIFFSYDSYGNLIEVVKKANEDDCIQTKVRYSYDSNNKLIEMKNYFTGNSSIINESINFTYDSNNEKINSYYYSNSNLLSNFPNVEITYGVYKTIFETSDGYKSYYSFDRFGHTINIYDNDGYAKFYKYEFDNENNFLNNKLIEESESVFYKYNKITNHGFENYDSNNLIIGWSTRGNASLNSTNRLYGEYALKLSSTSSSASQTIQLYGNTTYQLSAFIKVKEMDDYVNGGAYIEIKANDENGSIITSQSEYIAPNGKFEEYIKEFTVGGYEHCPYQVTISLKTSINTDVYFDNVQLVMGINDCRYNMLEDNSFENSFLASNSKWIGGSTCECEPNEEFGFYYRYIPSNTILKQTLDVSISKGTKLSFGGFVNSNGSKASIRLRFYNIETDTYSDYYTIGYSKDVSDFQYLMENVEVSLDGGCHQIEFEVVNNGRYGIYVDNLILMQDIFTNTYKYNIVGKPEIIKSYEKQFEFVRDTETNRKIEKIIIKKSENTTVINYEESSSQQTVNIDGSLNNITTTVYSDINQTPVATVVGTMDSKYFTNTTEYSHLNQFISKRTNEFNNSTSYEYDYLNGLITKVTDAKNIDTAYEYDYYERIIKIVKIAML